MLVTGDGQRRAEFERRFAGLPARRVQLRTRWLQPEDYPRIVGSADLGLCLHRSSSGRDIPMKVADLFGAGVPVCALDYGASLAERVRHGDNGLLFSTARQLSDLLFDLFESYPGEPSLLARLRTSRAAPRGTSFTGEAHPSVGDRRAEGSAALRQISFRHAQGHAVTPASTALDAGGRHFIGGR
jgi:beta-1,4-mannosyltransferase